MDGTMNKTDLEKALARGVEILNEFLPVKTYLFFPVLYSACVWAVRRIFDYRDRILAWQVWLDPDFVETKPDEFILHFFKTNEALGRAYADEIAGRDMKALRAAFPSLYPLCGLADSFLKALFKDDLDSGDYRKIAAQFEARAAKARDDIRPADSNAGFWKALEKFGREMASLGIHLLTDVDVQNMIVAAVKAKTPGIAKGG